MVNAGLSVPRLGSGVPHNDHRHHAMVVSRPPGRPGPPRRMLGGWLRTGDGTTMRDGAPGLLLESDIHLSVAQLLAEAACSMNGTFTITTSSKLTADEASRAVFPEDHAVVLVDTASWGHLVTYTYIVCPDEVKR